MVPKVSIIIPIYNVKPYLEQMLDSVANQSMRDYEALLIDDGSFDGSAEIAKSFAEKDIRFKYIRQENAGVSAARNHGIEIACGEFLAFYDADDYIPKNALKSMYKSGSSQNADIVIGIMEEKNLGESLIYMHSVKLASKKDIDVMDEHLFGAWSICNKLFSRKFVMENGLRLEKLKNAEDGVFTFRALRKAKKICGAKVVSYNYMKRPFWEGDSATQTISLEYMESLLESHSHILKEAEALATEHYNGNINKVREYLRPLYVRFIEGELINGYYRNIWRSNDDLVPGIREKLSEYKRNIKVSDWKSLCKRHKDIDLQHGLFSKEELAEKPLVSIIVNLKSTSKNLNLYIESLYNQLFPRFEILISKEESKKVETAYIERSNFRIIEGIDELCEGYFIEKALNHAKGEYVVIQDECLFYTKKTLKTMWYLAEKCRYKSIGVNVRGFDGKNYFPIKSINSLYGYCSPAKRIISDGLVGNKLILKSEIMKAVNGKENGQITMEYLSDFISDMKCKRIRKSAMIAQLKDYDTFGKLRRQKLSKSSTIKSIINSNIDYVTYMLKQNITIEDIEKVRNLGKRR